MALLDAKPQNSPDGIAVAMGALLSSLMETLIKKGILNKYEAYTVVTTAQTDLAHLRDSPAFSDAQCVLQGLTKRFPPQ